METETKTNGVKIQEVGNVSMKWKEKYIFLYKLYDDFDASCIKNNFGMIKSLSKDVSPQIRSLVAKVCSRYTSSEALDILLNLSTDSNNLVRVEVADSLCSFVDEIAYQKLTVLCDDPYYMVRGYAEYGIGLIGNNDCRKNQSIQLISKKLKEELFYFNRLQCHMALYFLGDDKALLSILQVYNRLKYQDQCLVLRFMIDVLSKRNKELIVGFVSRISKHGIPSVDALIDQLLKQEV